MYRAYNIMTLYSFRELINKQIIRFPHNEELRLIYKEIDIEIKSRS